MLTPDAIGKADLDFHQIARGNSGILTNDKGEEFYVERGKTIFSTTNVYPINGTTGYDLQKRF